MDTSNPTINDDPTRLTFLLSNIQKYLPSWEPISLADVTFSRLTGFTNITYKVKITNNPCNIQPDILVYREFCPHEGFFSRKDEIYIFSSLGSQGLGPKSYGCDDKTFRLEEFIVGRHPNPDIMSSREFTLAMAKYIAYFHQEELLSMSKNPSCLKFLNKERPYEDFWAITEKFKPRVNEKEKEMIEKLQSFVCESEIHFLREKLKEINGKITFCHNDLNANNIFIKDTGLDLENSLIFIDLEYCNYNYRGYDIGDFMMERTYDYNFDEPPYFKNEDIKFPSEKLIEEFATAYVFFEKAKDIKDKNWDLKILDYDNKQFFSILVENKINVSYENFLEEIKNLSMEIKIGILVSLFYWILWSGSICQDKNIKFDYLLHGISRMESYLKLKKLFF